MYKQYITSAVVFVLALPVAAQADQNLARELKVAPGDYTLNEMVQIYNSGSRRKQQMDVIEKNREAFRQRAFGAIQGTGASVPEEVTREARHVQ